MIEIDILTRIIAPGTRAWRLFPGSSYRFLDTFLDQNQGFLDIPGLELPQGPILESNELLPRMVASQALADTLRTLGPDAQVNIDWRDYSASRNSVARGIFRNSISNFYEVAQLGDLVVAPSTMGIGEVYVGAIADRPNERHYATFRREYGDNPIPARRINWLTVVLEHKLSFALSSALRHQNPFTLLERSLFTEVFALAYTNFEYAGLHSGTVYNTKDDYIDRDSAFLGLVSQVSAILCQRNERDSTGVAPGLLDSILTQHPIEYSCSQTSDIHSEGFNRFLSSKATPLIIVSLVAILGYLGTNSSEDKLPTDIQQVVVTNSISGPHDECTAVVDKATKMFLQTTPIDEVWRLCKLARDARDRAGLEPDVSVTSSGRPAQPAPAKRKPR
jgi:hypothetical protein